jgi:indolepyruvate decarboxylase
MYDLGPHPILVDWDDPGAGWVEGYVRATSDHELSNDLDVYEGVAEAWFARLKRTTREGREAWVYVYLGAVPQYAKGPIARWDGPRRDAIRPSFPREEAPVATAPASAPAVNGASVEAPATIGQYLIDRLAAIGVNHVFGIPGDYILGLYKMLESSPIELVGVTKEDSAGFAADAYARINGIGCVAVTYCVGGLSLCNSVAGAYAEKSPVIVLGGSPGMNERDRNPLLHHKVKGFETQFEVMEKLTVASTVLDDPMTAFSEIDRVLTAAQRYKRPVYIEIPRDMIDARQVMPHRTQAGMPPSDPDALREAVDEACRLLSAADRPMILADVEIHRFGLQDELLALAEEARLPIATTILGKSVVSEAHPLFVGVYEGGMGKEEVTRFVEDSDCLLMLGCFLTDINLGIFTAKLDPAQCINATSEDLQIRYHHYREVRLDDFIRGLRDRRLKLADPLVPAKPTGDGAGIAADPTSPVTSASLFATLNGILDDDMVVIADIGDALFGAADLVMSRRTEFISPAYYTSMGFGVPAALGAAIANRSLRPLVIVGDGAFQMTGMELSTIARQGLNPIVVVMNNKGYTTERFLLEGSFNDIHEWAYHKIPEVLGAGLGLEVRTREELDDALRRALANTGSFTLLNVHLDPLDRSPALERLAQKLSARIRPSPL